ncbi:hypothetical protein ACQPZF_02115 [Actinosynnema sp. CS-041913]|uniref:hypothetical protein n=1 Tax=Actinosynnema sp. CS-041913 TaxID=3239917 RepID=UPI003D8BE0D2
MGRAEQKSPAPRRLAVVAAVAAGVALAAAGCSAGQVTQTDTQVAAVNGASGTVGPIAVRDAQLLFPVAHGYYQEGEDAPVVVVIANNGTQRDKLLSVTSDISAEAEISGDAELEPGTAVVAGADQDDAGSHSTTSKPSSVSPTSGSPTPPAAGTTTTGTVTSGTTPGTTTAGATTTGTTAGGSVTGTTASSATSGSSATSSSRPSSSVAPTKPGEVRIVLKGLTKDLRPGQTLKVTFLFEQAGPLTLEVPIGATPEPRKEGSSEH